MKGELCVVNKLQNIILPTSITVAMAAQHANLGMQ